MHAHTNQVTGYLYELFSRVPIYFKNSKGSEYYSVVSANIGHEIIALDKNKLHFIYVEISETERLGKKDYYTVERI